VPFERNETGSADEETLGPFPNIGRQGAPRNWAAKQRQGRFALTSLAQRPPTPIGATSRARRFVWGTLVFAAIVAGVVAFSLGLGPRRVAASLIDARAVVGVHPIGAAIGFAALYVAFAVLSLPGASTMSVAGGALFGPWLGVPLVSLSSTAGATVAMLAARHLFRDAVAARFPALVERVDRGVARDGARWLFAARLTPVIPFFAVNLAVGLTRMPARVFAPVTLLGALPIVVVYVFAGQAFATIEHPGDVLSGRILVALFALALAPFGAKALGEWRASRARLGA
jgi:uncharacterized membrane protein YdjX (TVP38/TMEM64 family)